MEEKNNGEKLLSLPGEWALKKILGPTLDNIGEDFGKIYQIGKYKIIEAAKRRISNMEDGASANLRVSRDVFWNGAYTDEGICAEYFGGILASSRSIDGKDDSGVYYVDLIKSLSSAQLHLHYVIYRSLNKFLISDKTKKALNVGLSTDVNELSLYFTSIELLKAGLKIDTDLEALYQKGLLYEYKINAHKIGETEHELLYTKILPTTLGIQLFTIANNMFQDWREFPTKDFGDFKDITLPKYFAPNIERLLEETGFNKSIQASEKMRKTN